MHNFICLYIHTCVVINTTFHISKNKIDVRLGCTKFGPTIIIQIKILKQAHIPRGEEDRQREMGERKKTKESWKMVTVLVKGTLSSSLIVLTSDNERSMESNQTKKNNVKLVVSTFYTHIHTTVCMYSTVVYFNIYIIHWCPLSCMYIVFLFFTLGLIRLMSSLHHNMHTLTFCALDSTHIIHYQPNHSSIITYHLCLP